MIDNPQEQGLLVSTSSAVPGQLDRPQIRYYQLSEGQPLWSQRRPAGSASRLITIGLLLILTLSLFGDQGIKELKTPPARQSALATRLPSQRLQSASATPSLSLPVQSTPVITPTRQTIRNISQVDQLLTTRVAQRQFSGSVLIAQDGQVLLSKGYSMADWDEHVSNTPHTKFYVGSITKQFTAMAILILQEQGKLHVQDHICSYIVPCPAQWQPLTIHHLLTHSSGIPDLDDSSLSYASPKAWIASFDGVGLVFTPGGQFSYCNVCYQILAYVVEQVSGEPYSTFLQQAIFDPLQMQNTGFDPHYLSLPDHAVGYASWQVKDISIGEDVAPQWSFLFGAGLLYSTVEDLYRWDQGLYANTLVSQETLNEAFTPYLPSQYPGSSYGYGWFIAKAPTPGHRLLWHDGQIDGFRNYIGRYIDDQVTIIVLSNLSRLDELALAHTLEQLVFAHS
jgi:CubicO group peptidase (beta-lactamase class C family)